MTIDRARCIPILASLDIAESRTFYVERLGFTVNYEAPNYLIVKRDDLPDMARFELRTTRELARFIAAKGSVTLDGVSLTVNTVDDVTFSVLIIPHTLSVTTLSGWKAGSEVNIEVDLMARYAARLSEMK